MREACRDLLIEGYASLFGSPDLAGDVVRAGAFTRSLSEARRPSMLLQHARGRIAGRWTVLREDGRGLFVRGLVSGETLAGREALSMIRAQRLNGLSIGFLARCWSPRTAGGRELKEIDLREVSLVASPLLPGARFTPLGQMRPELIAA
jgi:uncharacterized protein